MFLFKYTLKKFAKDVAKVAKTYRPDCKPIFLESESAMSIATTSADDKADMKIHLNGVYNQWKDLPAKDRLIQINNLLEPMFNPSERTNDERIANLRLRARSIEEIRIRQLEMSTVNNTPTVYGDGAIVLELVEDSESTVSLVPQEGLEPLELSAEQAYKIAAAALIRDTGGNQWKGVGEIWYSNYNDDYDFARLLVAGNDAHLPFTEGPCIAYAPSHSVCVICNKEDANLIGQMISVGDEMCGNQRSLSKNLWTIDSAGQWVAYKNDTDSDIARIVKTQEVIESADGYAHQQGVLDRINAEKSLDVFVASYVGMQNNNGEIVSMCTYSINLPSFLPVTDMVNVFEHESNSVLCVLLWDEFVEIVGSQLQQLDDYMPVRVELTQTLTNDQIDLFRQRQAAAE